MIHSPKFAEKFRELRKHIKDLSRFKGLRPIINVIQNLYLILRFIQDYRETNKYLLGQWGYGNKNFIPLESSHEICFPETKGMFVYNPTLLLDQGNLRFFVRVTNQSNIPNVNIFGQLKKRGARSGAVNGIAEFALDNNYNVINYREIMELSKVPNFEDPKAFLINNQVHLFCNQVIKEPEGTDRNFICNNAIVNLETREIISLKSPYSKNIEKNWIPIDYDENFLRMFYSCNPLTLLRINLRNGQNIATVVDEKNRGDFHGGSQIVSLTDNLYVRVVRRKMQMKSLGMIAISYLMFHDDNMQIVNISKPFIFRKFGFEICNGLARIDDYLIFTWGEDDIRNFMGKLKIDDLILWAFE